MILNYDEVNDLDRYKIMSDTVVPRPIAWIVTEDEGVINAAPFSYFIPLSSNPATLIVAIGEKTPNVPKDTLANILKNKKATICFTNKDNLEQLKLCATPLKKEQSEVVEYNIQTQKVLEDFPPMISSSQSTLFCEYYDNCKTSRKNNSCYLRDKKAVY